jgi:hypothetical protein
MKNFLPLILAVFSATHLSYSQPILSGFSGWTNPFRMDVCHGETFCVDIYSADPSDAKQVTLTYVSQIKDATFTSTNERTPKGTFCWVAKYESPGCQTLLVTATNDKGESITRSYRICVRPEVTADFDYFIDGDEVTFMNKSQEGKSFNWDFGDGNFSNAAYPVHVYNSLGKYPVTLTNYSHCTKSVTKDIEIVTFTKNPVVEPPKVTPKTYRIKICPNPSEGNFFMLDARIGVFEIKVYSPEGKLVYSRKRSPLLG